VLARRAHAQAFAVQAVVVPQVREQPAAHFVRGRRREQLAGGQVAIEGYIAALKEDGLPVPDDRLETLVVAV
jgi:hypothetical protein